MSKVWKYFRAHDRDNTKAQCTLCEVLVVRGKTPKSFSTKPLWNHLNTTHRDTYSKLKRDDKSKGEEDASGEASEGQGTSSSTHPTSADECQQPTIMEVLSKKTENGSNSSCCTEITRVIGDFKLLRTCKKFN